MINFISKKQIKKIDNVVVYLFTDNFLKEQKTFFKNANFEAKFEEIMLFNDSNLNNISILCGLDSENKLDDIKLQKLGNTLFDFLNKTKFKNFTFIFNNIFDGKVFLENYKNNDKILFSILEGIELSNYNFNKYFTSKEKEEKEKNNIQNIDFVIEDEKSFNKKYKDFSLVKENIFLCRDLINEPANVINPSSYTDLLKDFTKYGLEIEILNKKELQKLNMNALLAIGQGSDIEPKIIVLKWNGLENDEKPVALVGKGVTFDSGGLCIKPDSAMYDMKIDMAGSAVVVSTLKLLAQRKAKVNVVGVIPLVENMPSGKAIKPGDIVKSMSDQTIEILHTDAEGRVILADALYYAVTKFKPKTIIDLATLTGAICVALGEDYAGLFSNNKELIKEIQQASANTGEECWNMPLSEIGEKYDLMINSTFADMKNITGVKYAGAITAAQFLQRFIDKHTKWAHIDIAGVTNTNTAKFFTKAHIANGFGVRLLNNLIENYYEK